MHFPIEFLLLGLVGEGSRWIGNKGWLPPKESGMPFKSRGKVGYLGADGKPAEDETGKKLSAKEKAAIMKREEEMKAKEMGIEVKPNNETGLQKLIRENKNRLTPTPLSDAEIDKLKPRKERVPNYYMGRETGNLSNYDIYDDRVAVKTSGGSGYKYNVEAFIGVRKGTDGEQLNWGTVPSGRRSDNSLLSSFRTKKEASDYAKKLLKLRLDFTRIDDPDYAQKMKEQLLSL